MDTAQIPNVPGVWEMILKSVGTLALILAILALFLFLFKWLSARRSIKTGKPIITMLASFSLGPKEKIFLIEAKDQTLLIGATAAQINTLHTYNSPPIVEQLSESSFNKILENAASPLQSENSSGIQP